MTSSRPRSARWAPVVGALALLLPLLAAFAGKRGPYAVELNLGPGDAPYLEGFLPAYEIEDKLATHWTTYAAAAELPLRVRGGPVDVVLRYARVFGETAVVETRLGGTLVDSFDARGGRFEERRATRAILDGPLELELRMDSHERRNMGLKLDWIRFDLGERASARLAGWAAFRPFVLTLMVVLVLAGAGIPLRRAILLAGPAAAALGAALLFDPWLVHRLLRGLPLAVALFGASAAIISRWLVARGRAAPGSARTVVALMLAAFLARALFVNHPDFYYPDLRTHARLIGFVQDAGLRFAVSPSDVISEHGLWRTEAYGQTYAFPYTPAFHLPFAPFDWEYDGLVTALKLAGAAVSTIPVAILWAFARSLGLSSPVAPFAALLAIAIPTYVSRLSYAFLPSLFGHAVDLWFLYWCHRNQERLGERRVWLAGGALVAASQLAYVSGVLNVGLFVPVLALFTLAFDGAPRKERLRRARGALAMAIVGGVLSFAIFYRDFLPMVLDVASRALGGIEGASSRYPVRGFFQTAFERTYEFFRLWYPALAVWGAVLLRIRGAPRLVLSCWLATYFLLLLGRARVPDLFLHGHETLFVTPLVCLAAAVPLAELFARGGGRRAAALGLAAALVVVGFLRQWSAIAEQLSNAT